MSKLFAVREELLNNKELRDRLESFVKETEIPTLSVLQLEDTKIVCKPPLKKVTDDSEVSAERKQATLLSQLLIQEGENSSFFASENVLLRQIKAMNILFGVRKELFENKEKCAELKFYLEEHHSLPLTVITDIVNGVAHCSSSIPTNNKTFDVTKLPTVNSQKWVDAASQLVDSEDGENVLWFSSVEKALSYIEHCE